MASGALGERSIEVRLDGTILGLPFNLVLVGKNASHECGSIVTADTDKQQAKLRYLSIGPYGMIFEHVLERPVFIEQSISFNEL